MGLMVIGRVEVLLSQGFSKASEPVHHQLRGHRGVPARPAPRGKRLMSGLRAGSAA
jgi:hypothetical protein